MAEAEPLALFDAHCMVGSMTGPAPPYTTVPELIKWMEYYSIQEALVFHTLAWKYDATFGNQKLMEELQGQERLHPCWVLLPTCTGEQGSVEEIRQALNRHRVCGVRFFPQSHNFQLADWNLGELLDMLEEMRMPVFLVMPENPLPTVEELCRSHPGLPVVLGDTSYRSGRILYSLWEKYENFHVELGMYTSYRGVEDTVARFGASRLLFGSCSPRLDPSGPIATLAYADISEQDKRLIAGERLRELTADIRREG